MSVLKYLPLLLTLFMVIFAPSASAEPSMSMIKDDQSRPVADRFAVLVIGVDEYFNMPEANTLAEGYEETARNTAEALKSHGGVDTVILLLNTQASADNYVETVHWLRSRGVHDQFMVVWIGLGAKNRGYTYFLEPNSKANIDSEEEISLFDPSTMALRTWGTGKRTIALLLTPPHAGTITAKNGEKVELDGVTATDWNHQDNFALSPQVDASCAKALIEYINILDGGPSTLDQFVRWLTTKAEYAKENPAMLHCGARPVISQSGMMGTDPFLPERRESFSAPLPTLLTTAALETDDGLADSDEEEPTPPSEGALPATPSAPVPGTATPVKRKPTIGLVAGGSTSLLLSGVMGAAYISSRMRLQNASYEEYGGLARDSNVSGGIAAVSGVIGAGLMASAIVVEF